MYLDDGESLAQLATKYIKVSPTRSQNVLHGDNLFGVGQMSYFNGTITLDIDGSFDSPNPLGNLTIAGLEVQPPSISLNGVAINGASTTFANNVLSIQGLEEETADGLFQRGTYTTRVTQIGDGQVQVVDVTQAGDALVQETDSV